MLERPMTVKEKIISNLSKTRDQANSNAALFRKRMDNSDYDFNQMQKDFAYSTEVAIIHQKAIEILEREL